ncbi:hypothetical protein LQK80_33270 [Bacillus thuringiensis]|nr:hypothetical protein [Bacillus thuringiensis]
MTPSGKQYKYVLFSENKIYVNPKTGVVTAYEEGAVEGRVLDKNGNVVAIWYITAYK